MKNKRRNIILKTSIAFSGFLCIVSLLFPFVCIFLGFAFEEIEKIWIVLLIVAAVSALIMLIIQIMLFGVKGKKTKK